MIAIKIGLAAACALTAVSIFTVPGAPAHAAGDVNTGNTLYHTYCRACHGPRMINAGGDAYDLRKFPLGQRARFMRSVKNGKKGKVEMPAFGDIVSQEELNHIWAYIKTRGK